MCFVWIWEQTAIISLYSINWLVGFYNWDGVCLLRGSFYIPRSAHTAVFMCFVWIWEQTAIISLYSINWLVFITETDCLLTTTELSHQVNVDTYFYVIYCTICFDPDITIFIEVTIAIAVKHTTLCLHIYINRPCVHYVSCPYVIQYH